MKRRILACLLALCVLLAQMPLAAAAEAADAPPSIKMPQIPTGDTLTEPAEPAPVPDTPVEYVEGPDAEETPVQLMENLGEELVLKTEQQVTWVAVPGADGSAELHVRKIAGTEGRMQDHASGSGPVGDDKEGDLDTDPNPPTPSTEKEIIIDKIIIESGVTHIGARAFYGNYKYCKAVKDNTIYTMSYSSEVALEIADTVESIGEYAFAYFPELKNVIISGSVGIRSFESCTGLEQVTIANGVQSIGNYAFNECSNLKRISISASVTSIGALAWNKCYSLKEINVSPDNASYCSVEDVLYTKDMTKLVKYPESKMETYFKIPETVTSVEVGAFSRVGSRDELNGLKRLVIPSSVKTFSEKSFLCEDPDGNTYYFTSVTDIYYEGTAAEWKAMVGSYNWCDYPVIDPNDDDLNIIPEDDQPIHNPRNPKGRVIDPNENMYVGSTKEIKASQAASSSVELMEDTIDENASTLIWKAFIDGHEVIIHLNWKEEKPPLNAPTVVTKEASNITKNSAVLSGEVTADGGAEVTKTEFVYWSKLDDSARYTVTADENFTATLSNLTPSTTYYYYAKAVNSAGEGVGNVLSFETEPEDMPRSISVSPGFLSLEEGATGNLLATVLPTTAKNRTVIWSSSNLAVVKVDSEGKLTAVSAGSAVITATTVVNRLTASVKVEVTKAPVDVTGKFDFSEWNMAAKTSNQGTNGFDRPITEGGNLRKSTAYLARWDGTVSETNDKWPHPNQPAASISEAKPEEYHVQEVLWLPARTGPLDNDEFKAAIMQYGGIYSSFYCDNKLTGERYFDRQIKNFCYPEAIVDDPDNPNDGPTGGHAITVIGWDDDYPASNFTYASNSGVTYTPAGNGAFICKNSWGTDRGENGFFYISYYDKYFGYDGDNGVLPSLEKKANYNTIYQYDPLGFIRALGYDDRTFAANVFPQKGVTLKHDETLRAVSFYTRDKNVAYNIYVVENYKNNNSLTNKGRPVASGIIKDMGYHTVSLDQGILLKAGTRFAVIVEINAPKAYCCYEFPYIAKKDINADIKIWGGSSKARANADESYYSSSGIYWKDLTNYIENANFCIKAFTDNGSASTSAQLFEAIDNENRTYTSDKVYTLDELIAAGMPVSQRYLDWAEQMQQVRLFEEDETDFGYEPPMFDIGGNDVSFVEGAQFPKRYDLRDEGNVTRVQDQQTFGLCWTFATYGSLESCLLKKSKQLTSDNLLQAGGIDNISDAVADMGSSGFAVETVTLDSTLNLSKNATYRLTPTFAPVNATDTSVTWKSSDESVAMVDTSGTVTAKASGTATITATAANGASGSCNVTVQDRTIAVTGVTLTDAALTKQVGEQFLAAYQVQPATATNRSVSWTSSNPDVVSIDENGVMTGVAAGTATITVKTLDGNYTKTLTVTITEGEQPDGQGAFSIDSLSAKKQGSAVKVSANVRRTSGTLNTVTVYAALYDAAAGKMRGVSQQALTVSNEGAKASLEIPLPDVGTYTVKLFVLDSKSAPVAEMKSVSVS